MKYYTLLITFLLAYSSAFSQNSYILTVKAKFIRLYSAPSAVAIIPNEVLEFDERIRCVRELIEARNKPGYTSDYFIRVYRKGNTEPMYVNTDEAAFNWEGQRLVPSSNALQSEKEVTKIWWPDAGTHYKVDDILFYDGRESQVFSDLNRASVKLSKAADDGYVGFYKITKIIQGIVYDKPKIFFVCTPIQTPFNKNSRLDIYVDSYLGIYSVDLQSLDHVNYFSSLMLKYANEQTDSPSQQFYLDYLTSLYGSSKMSQMNQFELGRLLQGGRSFMDSIYQERRKIFDVTMSEVYLGFISDYDFNNQIFTVYTFHEHELIPIKDARYNQDEHKQSNFLNLNRVVGTIHLPIDTAEKFLNEVAANEINPMTSRNNEIALLVNFKFVPANMTKKMNVDLNGPLTYLNYPKLITSIDVTTGAYYTRSYFTRTEDSKDPFPKLEDVFVWSHVKSN